MRKVVLIDVSLSGDQWRVAVGADQLAASAIDFLDTDEVLVDIG